MDVRIEKDGIFLFHLLTPEAEQWVEENVSLEGWQWMGDAFCVDGLEYAMNICWGMRQAGLEVE